MISDGSHLDAGDAALYALGALDDVRRLAVERHLRGCAACLRRIGEAEDEVARLAAAQPERPLPAGLIAPQPPRKPVPRGVPAWAALAAVLVAAAIPSGYFWQQTQVMHRTMRLQADVVNRLAATPFRTAAFRGMGTGTSARVMYAPDGSWYLVVVRGASRPMQVAWMHAGERTTLGAAEAHGEVAMLYLPQSHRMDRLALMDGPRVVAEATLAY